MTGNHLVDERRAVSVLRADPDLGVLIPAGEADEANRRAVARTVSVERPSWDGRPPAVASGDDSLGLLVLDGLLLRRVAAAGHLGGELLGVGDLIRPWDADGDVTPLPVTIDWKVLQPTRMAVLDGGFARRIARWPGITAALLQRLSGRSRHLSVLQAVSHLPRINLRLLLALWLVAERWGTVVPDGVLIELPLTHSTLATLIGCRRPTVTLALGRLSDAGLLSRPARYRTLLTRSALDALTHPEHLTAPVDSG